MTETQLTDRVERLRELSTELEACESAAEVYDRAVTASEAVIASDAASICTVEDGVFVPRAVVVPHLIPGEALPATEGIAGQALTDGESILVDDVDDVPAARPTSETFRSVLTIPFSDGVLQFHAEERGAFSSIDQEFGELLVATVRNALARVKYERALGSERDQFAALFENVPDPAIQYTVDGGEQIVKAVNSAFVRVFGSHGETVVGEPVADVVLADDQRGEPERLATPESDRRTDVEVVRETASGPRAFLLRNVPMRTADDSIRGYLIYTDLTALKVRERELERKNERLDQFASIVSHDLRNPLNVAAGYLELAKDSHPCEELDEIEQAHRRMERLIENVLSLARDGTTPEETQPVHLRTAAREAWGNVATEEAALTVDTDEVVDAEANQLLQILENLFRNAVDHAGPDVHVRVDETQDGFAVEDDGPGIPPTDRERIFESGYSSACESTGLGLAIVRQITEAHGWGVDVVEGAHGGARFEFTLDRSEAPPEPTYVDPLVEGER